MLTHVYMYMQCVYMKHSYSGPLVSVASSIVAGIRTRYSPSARPNYVRLYGTRATLSSPIGRSVGQSHLPFPLSPFHPAVRFPAGEGGHGCGSINRLNSD